MQKILYQHYGGGQHKINHEVACLIKTETKRISNPLQIFHPATTPRFNHHANWNSGKVLEKSGLD